MICKKCNKFIEDDSVYCRFCGRKQILERTARKRANGEGTVFKRGNRYIAQMTIRRYVDENGKIHKKTISRSYQTRKEASVALATLQQQTSEKKQVTFKELYDKWLPTHSAGKSTIGNYTSAFKYFEPIWGMKIADIDVDDLQECIDSCGYGKRTQQNMRTVCGLVYKYGIPRHCIPENLNLSQFLTVSGEDPAPRSSFTDEQIESIREQIGSVFGADYVYCLIYLGLRPSEFLALTADSFDAVHNAVIVGRSKTEKSSGRPVTISPKILPYIQKYAKRHAGTLICDATGGAYNLKQFTENVFYPVLQAAKIDNPVEDGRHKYTPHSCRHTFSTLMKRVSGANKDKLDLIGHTSDKMLRYYQDTDWDDLRRITDAI